MYSGAEAVFAEVCLGLHRAGVDLGFLLPAEAGELRERLRPALDTGAPVIGVPAQSGRFAAPGLYRPAVLLKLRRAIRHLGAGALLVNLPSAELGGRALLARRRGRPPAVGLMHIHQSLADSGFVLGALRDRLAAPAIRRCDRVLVVSPTGGPSTAKQWRLDRQHVKRLPLPRAHVSLMDRGAARSALGIDTEDGPVVALIGRLSIKQKGHDVLLAAAPQVLARRPDALFLLVGSGADRAALEHQIAANGIQDRVRLTGPVVDVSTTLAAVDAVVFPSRFEGLPLGALEALEAGRPGIVSAVDGLASLWPESWQVPPDNPTMLAHALLELLDEPPSSIARTLEHARARATALTDPDPAVTALDALSEVAPAVAPRLGVGT